MDRTTNSAATSTRRPGLLINRNFGLLWLGGAISVIGDYIFETTLILWITLSLARRADGTAQPWVAVAISGLLIAVALPTFVIGPLAGVFVDRWDKRRTMLAMDLIRAVLVALLVLATNIIPLPFLPDGRLSLTEQLIAVYACVFLVTIASQFFSPSRMALIADLVPDAQRAQASSLTQVVSNLAILIGPGIAPLLYVLVGPEWAIGINALSFAFSFVMLTLIHPPRAVVPALDRPRGNFVREFGDGVRQTFSNRVTSTLLITTVLIMFGVGPINSLDILFALRNLHAPVALYGLLAIAMGLTAVLGAILGGWMATHVGLIRTLIIALAGGCAGILVYSRMTSFWPAVALIAGFGIFQGIVNVPLGPLMLRVTPRSHIGRVVAILNPAVSLATMLSTILAGTLASTVLVNFHQMWLGLTFGPIDTIFTGGALFSFIAVVIIVARLGLTDPPVQAAAPSAEPEPALAQASQGHE